VTEPVGTAGPLERLTPIEQTLLRRIDHRQRLAARRSVIIRRAQALLPEIRSFVAWLWRVTRQRAWNQRDHILRQIFALRREWKNLQREYRVLTAELKPWAV
jgi:hypothetical protein